MSRLIFFIILTFFCSCNSKDIKTVRNPYNVSYKQLEVDTAIRGIVHYSGYFLCLQENLKIAVFDSMFRRITNLEDSLNAFSISHFSTFSDTLYIDKDEPDRLGYPDSLFYCAGNFKIQKQKYLVQTSFLPVNSWGLFDDPAYSIYSNQIGSAGFLVFFYNKESKKTFVTRSDGPRQIIKLHDRYLITEDGNFELSPAFRTIFDPTTLIEVSQVDASKLIQYYGHLVSPPSPLQYYKDLSDSIQKAEVNRYGNNDQKDRPSVPVYTFVKNNTVYSIVQNRHTVDLFSHESDSLFMIQQILDTTLEMQNISFQPENNRHFVTFGALGAKMINNRMQDYSNSGFIWIRDSTIDIHYYYTHKPMDE